jgi:DNA polymerase-3 subunit chi
MTRVSFYVLKGEQERARQLFACRLAEKAYKLGHEVFIHTRDAEHSEQINQALWAFRDDSFVPHQLNTDEGAAHSPVLIGHDTSPPRLMNLLINLNEEQPLFFSQFERVAELINDQHEIKSAGRSRYQFYKQRGYELETFKI